MPSQQTSKPSVSVQSFVYDLNVLYHSEFADFAAVPGSPEAKVALCELHLDSENALHEKTICAADDLFACGKSLAETQPAMLAKGKLTRAVFEVRFEDAERPHKMCICPPDQIIFEVPADAPRMASWLDKCRLRLPRQIAHALCLLVLALAGAFSLPDDVDDDDDDEKRIKPLICANKT